MNIEDFKKLVRNYTEENILIDEPHVFTRCQERMISLSLVIQLLLDPHANLIRITSKEKLVYKLYYRLSRKRELKVIIDLFTYQRIMIRTVHVKSFKRRF